MQTNRFEMSNLNHINYLFAGLSSSGQSRQEQQSLNLGVAHQPFPSKELNQVFYKWQTPKFDLNRRNSLKQVISSHLAS